MASSQRKLDTDSTETLRDTVGADATATFEEDPKFVDSDPTGSASSENLADDVEDEEDGEDELDENDAELADEDEDEDLEDDDEIEDEDEVDDEDDEDDDLDDDDEEDDPEDEGAVPLRLWSCDWMVCSAMKMRPTMRPKAEA